MHAIIALLDAGYKKKQQTEIQGEFLMTMSGLFNDGWLIMVYLHLGQP